MKNISLFFFLLLGTTMAGQVNSEPLEYHFVLGVGDELLLGDQVIRFKSVLSDSRCPQSVQCIWEGEAELLFEFYEDGKKLGETSFSTLDRFQGDQLAQVFPGQPFYLSNLFLSPYPRSPGAIAVQDYKVRLQVKLFPFAEEDLKELLHS